jgi:RNA polymerase sigma-70 factor, Bacteroides expansion family 1
MTSTKLIGKEILISLKAGNAKAFEEVFKCWYEPLVHFTNEYLSDFESSRNIAQNIFLKLWEKRELIDPDSNIRAYLYVAARNACLSHLRHQKIENTFFEKSQKKLERLQLNYDALEELRIENIDFQNLENKIQETIESLPPRCKEVFILSRFENLKNKEIAMKLDISVKAVEANITRALITLRENTKDYLPELLFFMFFISNY